MAEEVNKLFGFCFSPFACRIQLALKLKGIEYEYIEEDLFNKSDSFLKYNPIHKKVPLFVHNGKPISESDIILQYIDETWKDCPLLPTDPYDRAITRFWVKFIDETMMQTRMKSHKVKDQAELENVAKGFSEQLKTVEKELKGKDLFGGETMGYLDIVVFSIAYWVQVTREFMGSELMTEGEFPLLCKWMKRVFEMDVVKECIPPKDKHAAFIKAIHAPKFASN